MKRTSAIIGLIFLWCLPATAQQRELVLVTSTVSRVESLTALDTRMLFLGYAVSKNGRLLFAVRNLSDARINDVFLQHVVAMSQSSYDRRVLGGLIQQGRRTPPEVKSLPEVEDILKRNSDAISYMWLTDAAARPGLRILRVLWIE